ncbi:hypothetical protein D9M73_276750 [compost metagenome]
MQDQGAFQVRQECAQQVFVLPIERAAGVIARNANPTPGAEFSVDVGPENMEYVHRLQEVPVKLALPPFLFANELGAHDDLAIRQVDEGVDGVEILIVGVSHRRRGT